MNKLKSDKACGIDHLLNEYFMKFKDIMAPILVRVFNIIFDSGEFPNDWSKGIIIPLHKKGDTDNTDNYRGITLVSNLSKIFTSILNNRLLQWSEENNIISDAQFGFKHGSGTTEAIFALHNLISLYLNKKKKLYCCFIDYKKAFDTVDRDKLFFKLARSGITGKLLNIIKQIYNDVKSV